MPHGRVQEKGWARGRTADVLRKLGIDDPIIHHACARRLAIKAFGATCSRTRSHALRTKRSLQVNNQNANKMKPCLRWEETPSWPDVLRFSSDETASANRHRS